jgi:DNA polymerase-4
VFRLTQENWMPVMGARPTVELWGVGPKVSARLAKLGIRTVIELASADLDALAAEFGPRMGPWYAELARGEGASTVDDTPFVARNHSRETTFQRDLVEAADLERAARSMLDQVLDDVAVEGRPVVGLGVKVRYAPFSDKTFTRRIPATSDRDAVIAEAMGLVGKIEAGRPVRLLGVRAEMAVPEDARKGHTPTRSGW